MVAKVSHRISTVLVTSVKKETRTYMAHAAVTTASQLGGDYRFATWW